jgi:SAM-dependent methyltransferase
VSLFSADWLAIREPYDRRARNPAVLDAVVAALGGLGTISIVDIACGTGSTLRAIAARLPARQRWQLVDNDLGLLARAAALDPPPGVSIATRPVDLARDLELALDGPLDLVTASALLDLVSEQWLHRLVVETAARRLLVYVALTRDAEIELDPPDPRDAKIIAAADAHHGRDKGFGAAIGLAAAATAIAEFRRAGYRVVDGRSDWRLGPQDRDIQAAVLAIWAGAAEEQRALPRSDLIAWLTRRRDLVAAGRSAMRIGHVDFLALPDDVKQAG